MFRPSCNPQSCSAAPGRKRIDLKGISISTVHPPSKRPALESQTGFQSLLGLPSSVIWKSKNPPRGFIMNAKPLRRS